jgi:hypothetical protein
MAEQIDGADQLYLDELLCLQGWQGRPLRSRPSNGCGRRISGVPVGYATGLSLRDGCLRLLW